MLGLETESMVLAVDDSVFAGERAVQEIAGVELDARLGGRDLEHPSGLGLVHPGRQRQRLTAAIEHEVMVVADRIALICWILAPISVGLVKSRGVPATGTISPVGIRVSSTGV